MPQKESLQSIREWAATSFPNEFAKFNAYFQVSKFSFSQFRSRAGRIESTPTKAVKVGTTKTDGTPIYAWRGKDSFNVGHEVEGSMLQPHDELTDPQIDFIEPFCWVFPTENEVALARFESLMRYVLLMVKQTAYMSKKIDVFKENFPGACRDVVEGLASKAVQTPTRTSRAPQTPRMMNSSAQITPQRFLTPATPTLASSQHVSNLDQAFRSFRAAMLAEAGHAQLASQRETADLNTQIQDLRSRLTNAEKEMRDLGDTSTELNTRANDFESKLQVAEQEKMDLELEHNELGAKIQELEAKLRGAENDLENIGKERADLQEKHAAAEAEASEAKKQANLLKARHEEMKKEVMGAVTKQE